MNSFHVFSLLICNQKVHSANFGETWLVKGDKGDKGDFQWTDTVSIEEVEWTHMTGRCCFDVSTTSPAPSCSKPPHEHC